MSCRGGSLIERVELKREGMQITLNLRALLPADRFPARGTNLRMSQSFRTLGRLPLADWGQARPRR